MLRTTTREKNIGLNYENSLIGSLDTWPLVDIITWLNACQKSAMLRIGQGLDAGVLFFHNGTLFRCEWGKLSGETALIALLDVKDSVFMLIPRTPPMATPNIFMPTYQLLLQLSITLDESRRDQCA